jgi:hypothetical protein
MPPSDFEGGWVDCTNEDWFYVSATSFGVPTDLTAKYRKAAKLRWKEGGAYKYGYVVSSSYGTYTTVNLSGGSDFSLAGGAITDNYISYVENPEGFPDFFNWVPTIVGCSVDPSDATYRFCIKGRQVTIYMQETTAGTGDATNYTYTLPVAADGTANRGWQAACLRAKNNGSEIGTAKGIILPASPTLLQCFTSYIGAAWAAANGRQFGLSGFELSYEMG